jgi:tetratricopeptide (TPR) repeat protein
MENFDDPVQAINEFKNATRARPDFSLAYRNLIDAESNLGRDVEANSDTKVLLANLNRGHTFDLNDAAAGQLRGEYGSVQQDAEGDCKSAYDLAKKASSLIAHDDFVVNELDDMADALAACHDGQGLQAIWAKLRELQELPDPDTRVITAMQLEEWQSDSDWAKVANIADPDDLDSASNKVALAIAKGRTLNVIAKNDILTDLLYFDPRFTQTCFYTCHRSRGVLYLHDRKFRNAIVEFTQAIRQGPLFPQAYVDLGHTYLARNGTGDVEAAIASFVRAQNIAPNFADPLVYWARALIAAGDHAEAAKNRRGALDNYTAAIDKLRAANKLTPHWAMLHGLWADASERIANVLLARPHERTDSALAAASLPAPSGSPKALAQRQAKRHQAESYEQRRLAKACEDDSERALDAIYGTALEEQGEKALQAGDVKDAIDFFNRAEPLLPDSGRLALMLGSADQKANQPAAALAKIETAAGEYQRLLTVGLNPVEEAVVVNYFVAQVEQIADLLVQQNRLRDAAVLLDKLRHFSRDAYRIDLEEGQAEESIEAGVITDSSVSSKDAKLPKAIDDYVAAWKAAPGDRSSMAELVAHDYEATGQRLINNKNFDAALSNFESAENFVASDDGVGRARVHLLEASAFKGLGRQGQWRAECEGALGEGLTTIEWAAVEEPPVGSRAILCR